MNRLVKKAIILGIIGFISGLVFGCVMFGSENNWDLSGISKWVLLIGGIYGILPMAGSVVYEIERWSIAKATIVHFVCTFTGFFMLAIVQGWFKPGTLFFWIWTLLWIFVYFIIWLIQYLIYHRKVREMNEELKRIHRN